MKKILLICITALLAFSSCKKEDFYEKFVPEVLFYQGAAVQNADFVTTTLASGVTNWNVKARVSAPLELKEIKLYKTVSGGSEQLVETYTEFLGSPNVYNLSYVFSGITAETTVRINAIDKDNKPTSRTFVIKVTP